MKPLRGDRRVDSRITVELMATQFIDNRPIPSQISNLSASGIHMCHAVEPMSRSSRTIQVEIPLPGLGDALWVKGEVVFDSIGLLHHGTGIRFLAMAPAHLELLRQWLLTLPPPPAYKIGESATGLRV